MGGIICCMKSKRVEVSDKAREVLIVGVRLEAELVFERNGKSDDEVHGRAGLNQSVSKRAPKTKHQETGRTHSLASMSFSLLSGRFFACIQNTRARQLDDMMS